MKPSIFPPSTSATEWRWVWGPPFWSWLVEWNGGTHFCRTGSGTHTVGEPFAMGMPSAPG